MNIMDDGWWESRWRDTVKTTETLIDSRVSADGVYLPRACLGPIRERWNRLYDTYVSQQTLLGSFKIHHLGTYPSIIGV